MVRAMIVILSLFTSSALAANVKFHPEVSLEGEYSDNVVVSPGSEVMGDVTGRVRLVLPVVNSWNTGELRLSYSPAIERYQDASYLDNDAHRLMFSVDEAPDPRTAVHFDLGFTRSLDQGRPGGLLQDEVFLTDPSTRDRATGNFSFVRQVGRRMEWSGAVDGTDLSFQELDSAGAPSEAPEDRREYGAALNLDFNISQHSTFGFTLRHRSNDLEVSGSEDVRQLGLAWSRILGRDHDFRLNLGVSDRSGDFTFLGQIDPEEVSETEMFARFEWNRLFRRSQLRLVAAQQPTSGGTLRGTSTDRLVSLALSGAPAESWSWSVATRFASRDPLDPTLEVTDSVGVGGEVEWRPTQHGGYRMGFDYVDQSGDAAAGDRTLGRAWVGFVWYPRGPESLASGGEQ